MRFGSKSRMKEELFEDKEELVLKEHQEYKALVCSVNDLKCDMDDD